MNNVGKETGKEFSVRIYTDGSCLRNGQEGATAGYAAIMICNGKTKMISGKIEGNVTNNVAELTAVIEAVSQLKKDHKTDVTIVSDSEYIVKSVNEKRVASWVKNGWRTASKQPVKNMDLWKDLIRVCKEHFNCTFKFEYVEGHSGDALNEECDKLAKQAAKQ